MKKFHSHISLFLLLIFAFPQINNAIHYFVIEHHLQQYNSNEKQFHSSDKTHDCELSIYKTPGTFLFDSGYSELKKIILFFGVEKPLYNIVYKKIYFENISNKGPPFCWIIESYKK